MRKRTLRDRAFQSLLAAAKAGDAGGKGVVTNDRGEVLLVRHTYTPGWHFPGGGVENRETCALALRRELQEEAGIESDELELVSVHANHAFFPNDHVLVFRVVKWRQGKVLQQGEIAEICFADPLNPPEGVTTGTKRRLDELFGGKPASELLVARTAQPQFVRPTAIDLQ